jgi:hypothetical protein
MKKHRRHLKLLRFSAANYNTMKNLFGLIRLVTLIIVAHLFVSLSFAEKTSTRPKEKFHLYLLVGQSNMAGRGKVEAQDKKPHPRVLMLTKENRWTPAVAPLHFDKPFAGTGIGRTFGIRIAENNPDVTVGLIPCAAGGSPISTWEPGGYHGQTKSHQKSENRHERRSSQGHPLASR